MCNLTLPGEIIVVGVTAVFYEAFVDIFDCGPEIVHIVRIVEDDNMLNRILGAHSASEFLYEHSLLATQLKTDTDLDTM